jgi:hypothetical protein
MRDCLLQGHQLKRTVVYAAREGQALPLAFDALAAGPDVGKN